VAKFSRLMGEYNSETKTYSACAGTVTSPYTPDVDANLVGVRLINSRDAATTLTNHVQVKMTCTTFRPNVIEFGADGGGIQTAPVQAVAPFDWACLQPVKAGVPITIEARNLTADTPVGVLVEIYGYFEA
jgi:hypothetical protein